MSRVAATLNFILLLLLGPACSSPEEGLQPYAYSPPLTLSDEWATSTLTDEGLDEELLRQLVQAILQERFTDIHSILIVRHGKLVLEEYFHGFTASTPHVLFSTTKSYASTLVGIAIDQGIIDGVDGALSTLLPAHRKLLTGSKDSIRLRHLLSMSSGLAWDEWSTPGTSIENSHEQMMQAPSQIAYVLEQPLLADPGNRFTYSTGLSNLIAPILENAYGASIESFAEEVLFKPLAIRSYRWETVIDSFPSTGGSRGGLEMAPRDMIKLGQLFLNNGAWQGRQLLSAKWIETAIAPHIRQSENIDYGYQWWQRKYFRYQGKSLLEYDAVGDGGQWIFVFPELQLVVGFTGGNYTWEKGSDLMFQPVFMVQDYILPAVKY